MISDDKKRVSTYMSKEDSLTLDEIAKKNGISVSALLSIVLSGFIAYETGKSLGGSLGKFLFGGSNEK